MNIPTEWLLERVEDAPTSYYPNPSPTAALQVRMAWQKLKREAKEGDEVWAFCSPPQSRWKESKYAGYALVREGKILQSMVVTRG